MNQFLMKNPMKKGILLLGMLVLGGKMDAQVIQRVEIPSKKEITSFDNTTFCVTFLSDEKMWALHDIS